MLTLLLTALSFLGPVLGEVNLDDYVAVNINGAEIHVKNNRQPSLYTGDYGDCGGGSQINVTRFDAAYYRDNQTVLFHLGGDTTLRNESIMSTEFGTLPLQANKLTPSQCISACTPTERTDSS